MNHKIPNILAFMHVVEASSISAAAMRMGLSKSVISQRISDLEDILKVKLLNRSTRGVTATDQGKVFYSRAFKIIQQLDQISEEIAESIDMLCGEIRITAPITFGTQYLGPLLFDFMEQHPRLSLILELNDQIIDLSSEGYDLGICIGKMADSSLIARKLAQSKRVICCSPVYKQKHGLPTSIQELANEYTCIRHSNTVSSQVWQFKSRQPNGEPESVVIRSRIAMNNVESIRDAAIAGLGIAVLPEFVVIKAMAEGQLITVLPERQLITDTIYVTYPKNRYPSRKVHTVIEHIVTVFKRKYKWKKH